MKKRLKILTLILGLMMLLVACSKTSSVTKIGGEAQVKPMTLTLGTIQKTDSFDPTASVMQMGMRLVYDTVLIMNPVTNEIEPGLAKSWEFIDDKTLKLNLRNDVTFSNGEKMTAKDVLFSLSRFSQTRFASFYDYIDFDNCVIQDDYTLILKFRETQATCLKSLTDVKASVLCKSYVESAPKEAFWDKPVGTGPYTSAENVSGSQSTYARKDNYWANKPEAEKITIRNYSEPNTMFIDYENGALDIVIEVDSNNAKRVVDGTVKNSQYKIAPVFDFATICLPEYVKYFDDIRVRKAIAYAVNAPEVGQIGYGMMYDRPDSTLPNGVPYHKSVGVYEYNPQKAKELLSEAGYKPGDIKLRFVVINFPSNQKMAEAIQADLANVGIEVKVEAYDFPTAIPIFMKNGTDLGINGTGGGANDPYEVYATVMDTSSNGTVRLTDKEINQYLKAGKASIDPAVRKKNYEAAQQWMYDNVRQIPLSYVNSCNVYRDTINAFPTIIPNSPNLRYVTFK